MQAARVHCRTPPLMRVLCATEEHNMQQLLLAVQDFKRRVDLESMSAAYSRIRTSTGITEGASRPCSHTWDPRAHCTP